MAKDFTLTAYKQLLGSLMAAGYSILTVESHFCDIKKPGLYVVLRHDVDRRPHNALRMANLEYDLGVLSTYYFRKSTFNRQIIEKVAGMDHEIGYHYEVMDKARGDIGIAHAIFNSELEILRAWVPVKTCAAHGKPLTKYDNRTFFESFNPEQFGLVGEAYDVCPVVYYTDTGRNWQGKCNIKDFHKTKTRSTFKQTSELPQFLQISLNDEAFRSLYSQIYLSIHPERWNDGLAWYRQWVFDWGCNLIKGGLKSVRFNRT